jgi:hypothetical protein
MEQGLIMLANKKSLLAMSVAASLTLTGCFSDNDNNVKVDPPTPPTPTEPVVVAPEAPAALPLVVNASIVDTVTLDVVSANVSFLENGLASENILDVDGNAITTAETTDGGVVFTKKEGAELTEVTINVTAEGYIGKSFLVSLEAEEGQTTLPVQLGLVSKNNPSIADTKVEATTNEDGSSTETITAEAEKGKASAGASIPAGTVLKDADGNPVTGAVTLNVSGADPTSAASAAIVPEGLNSADSATTEKAAGVANIIMTDSSGKKVKQFSDPITVTMSIPASTTKADGGTIKTGDMLKLKSHNEDTGVWTDETNMVTVGALNAETGTFTGSFETNHLTFYASTVGIELCTSGITVAVSGDAVPPTGLTVSMSSSDASVSGAIRSGSSNNVIVSPGAAKRKGIAASAEAVVTVTDKNGTPWFTSGGEIPVCGEVPVTLNNPVTTVSEEFTVTATCQNSTQTVDMSGVVVTYRLANKSPSVASGTGGGTFTLADLIEGETYNVTVNARVPLRAGGTKASATITADGNAESLEVDPVCQVTTGS